MNIVNDFMKISNILILMVYSFGMAAGQLMFKAASTNTDSSSNQGFLYGLATNFWFLGAVALYATLTVMWVWILTLVPLSRAYPFVIVAFAITPLGAAYFFSEPLNGHYFLGLSVTLLGLVILLFSGG